jgi:hypothetical protein
VLTTWGSDHKGRQSPQHSKPEEIQKLTAAFRHYIKFSLHNSVEISCYVEKHNRLHELKRTDVMTGLFTEHCSAVGGSQINSTTTSKNSDSCSDRLSYPSASWYYICRVHGLCLVLRENVTIFKNNFGSPKCEFFASILLFLLLLLLFLFLLLQHLSLLLNLVSHIIFLNSRRSLTISSLCSIPIVFKHSSNTSLHL